MWQLISKLGPKTVAVLTAMGLVLVASVIVYALYAGHAVSFLGLSIDESNKELESEISALRKTLAERQALEKELELQIVDLKRKLKERSTDEEVAKLKTQLAKALTPVDLPGIWDAGMSRDEAVARVKAMKKSTDDYEKLAGSPDFVFLQLEREISNSGGAINTNIANDNERDVFRLIQTALQFIDAFQGSPDGAQGPANRALEAFQKGYNAQVPKERELRPLGFFGRRTLSIIRDRYWKIIRES